MNETARSRGLGWLAPWLLTGAAVFVVVLLATVLLRKDPSIGIAISSRVLT